MSEKEEGGDYGVHPCPKLVSLFKNKPYQGQDPEKSKVIIIGNDANYLREICEHKEFFKHIRDYHEDGVQFWNEHKVHHPFLMNEYSRTFGKRKGGVRYHKNFSEMGFNSDYAEHFSFVELLNVPTIGNTNSDRKSFYKLLNKDHLKWLESIIFSEKRKFVMVNQTLSREIAKISRKYGALGELHDALVKLRQQLDLEGKKVGSIALNSVVLYNGRSFSASVSNDYLRTLGSEIKEFIDSHSALKG